MSFPNQDYLAMLKGKPPYYPQVQQPQQTPMIYSNPQFMQVFHPIHSSYSRQTIFPKHLCYFRQPYMNFMPQYMMMQQIQQMQQMPSMTQMRMPMPTSPMPMTQMPPMMMPYPLQPPNPPQPKVTQNIPVTVKGTKVKLNLALIRDLPVEEDSVLDYDEIKKQKGDQQFIALKRKRRLIDQQETPIMQTRRRSEQSQYLEIREILQIDDKDMGIILEAYPDTKTLLQELKNGNLKSEIDELLKRI